MPGVPEKSPRPAASSSGDEAAYKLLYLAISHIEERTTSRGGTPKNPSITQRGSGTQGWKNALNHFAIIYPGRLPEGI